MRRRRRRTRRLYRVLGRPLPCDYSSGQAKSNPLCARRRSSPRSAAIRKIRGRLRRYAVPRVLRSARGEWMFKVDATVRVEEAPGFRRMFAADRLTLGLFFPIEAFQQDRPTMRDQERLAVRAQALE